MVWERRTLLGGITGWEHKETHAIIYVANRHGWEVILNGKPIHSNKQSEREANDLMDQYIVNYQEASNDQ